MQWYPLTRNLSRPHSPITVEALLDVVKETHTAVEELALSLDTLKHHLVVSVDLGQVEANTQHPCITKHTCTVCGNALAQPCTRESGGEHHHVVTQ